MRKQSKPSNSPARRSTRPFYQKVVWAYDKAFRTLLEKDDIPSLWKEDVAGLSAICTYFACECDRIKQKQGCGVDSKSFLRSEFWVKHIFRLAKCQGLYEDKLDRVDWYISVCREKLQRMRLGKSIAEVVSKARQGNPRALGALISTDPRWLYEPWVKARMVEESNAENRDFFYLLGSMMSDKKNKAFKPRKTRSTSDVVEYLSRNGIKPISPFPAEVTRKYLSGSFSTVKQLLDHLIDNGLIDPCGKGASEESLRRLLIRHNLYPTASKTALSSPL